MTQRYKIQNENTKEVLIAIGEDIEWFARELKAGSFCETVPKNEPS